MIFDSSTSSSPFNNDDFLSKIIPNWVSFVVQLVAFIILMIIVICFAYKPVKKMIQTRQEYIESNIREAAENNAASKRNIAQSEEVIIAGKKTANQIVVSAEETAKHRSDEIIRNAENEAERLKRAAEEDIIRMKEEAREEIRQEMVNIALDASSVLLKRNVTDEDNKRLVEDFVKDAD